MSLPMRISPTTGRFLFIFVALSAFIHCHPIGEKEADAEQPLPKEAHRNYALIKAYENQDINLFRALLQQGANPNIRINRKCLPLLIRIIDDKKRIFFHALLEAEPDTNIQCYDRSTPITAAMTRYLNEEFSILLEKKPRLLVPDQCNQEIFLYTFHANGDHDLKERAMEQLYCEAIDFEELRSFFRAVENDDLHAVKEFLDAFPHFLHRYNNEGETPFTWAINKHAMRVARHFIDDEPINNKKNLLGDFPAYIALKQDNREIYQILIERNNQTHRLTDLSESLLHLAVQKSDQDEIMRLIELKVAWETINFEGFQAFDYLNAELREKLSRRIRLPPPTITNDFRMKTYPAYG